MITPKQAAEANDKIFEDQLAAAERILDGKLAANFATGRRVAIAGNSIPIKDHYLRKRLFDNYRKVGWKVEESDCQREGLTIYFSAAKAK